MLFFPCITECICDKGKRFTTVTGGRHGDFSQKTDSFSNKVPWKLTGRQTLINSVSMGSTRSDPQSPLEI